MSMIPIPQETFRSAMKAEQRPIIVIHDEASDIDPLFFAAWRESQGQPVDAQYVLPNRPFE